MSITLNSVVFGDATRKGPSDIRVSLQKIGTLLEAADGTRHFVQRGVKRTWIYTWDGITDSLRSDLRTIASLSSTFPHVDVQAVSRTCQTEEGDYDEQLTAILIDGTLHWRISLTVREA